MISKIFKVTSSEAKMGEINGSIFGLAPELSGI